jgi:hypothetical protein
MLFLHKTAVINLHKKIKPHFSMRNGALILTHSTLNESPCSKLQGIIADFILFSPHPNPLRREREKRYDPVASYRE